MRNIKPHRRPTFRLRSATFGLLVILLASAHGEGEGQSSQWFPLDIEHGNVRIATKVGGVPGYSLLDTSASLHSINKHFIAAHELDLRSIGFSYVRGINNSKQRRRVGKVAVQMLGTVIDLRTITELDLGPEDIQIKFGAPFFESFIVQLDYPNQRMRLLDRGSMDLNKHKNVQSRREFRVGSPMVKVNLDGGESVWLTLDTSNGYGNDRGIVIERNVAARAGWLNNLPIRESQLMDVHGDAMRLEQFSLPSLKIGPYELGNVSVSVPALGERALRFKRETTSGTNIKSTGRKSKGYISYDVLKHFVLTIDYSGGDVHLSIPSPAQPIQG
ncbi:MAG: signal protein PDZ [Pseudomonadota bacterium]